ncbi:MAG: helix-turn-helix domain-containing protein [Proteobacteria bacterium]|nr:helix-turn-helix domain-containing protein [Pseudomonadota bacterium]
MARLVKSTRKSSTFPIGKLSARTGCNIETIRYYERIKILPAPPRSPAGQRVYDESHLRRLHFVRRARELGFPLDRIRELLAMEDGGVTTCGEVQRITLDHLAEIGRKIADLRRLERTLRDTAAKCVGGAMPECPVIEALAKPTLRAPQ